MDGRPPGTVGAPGVRAGASALGSSDSPAPRRAYEPFGRGGRRFAGEPIGHDGVCAEYRRTTAPIVSWHRTPRRVADRTRRRAHAARHRDNDDLAAGAASAPRGGQLV